MTAFTISTHAIPRIEKRLTVLSKRAVKLNLSPLTWTLSNQRQEQRFTQVEGESFACGFDESTAPQWLDLVDIEITGESPIMPGGWWFITAIEAVDDGVNLILSVPGVDDIDVDEYKAISMTRCDHCHVKHNRKAVYVVRDSNGDESVVGKSCLKDFTGHMSPESIVMWATMWREIEDMAEDKEYNGSHGPDLIDTFKYVTHVAACVRVDGWLSKSQAEEMNCNSTASDAIVTGFMSCKTQDMKDFSEARQPIAEDINTAREAIAYAQAMDTLNGGGDFLHNVQVLSNTKCFDIKRTGLVACITLVYNKEINRRKKIESSTSEYLGKVKDKITVQATFEGMALFDGYYGAVYICQFDSNGSKIVWWASKSPELTPGVEVELTGRVKKHDEFKNEKQTTVTHCKVKELNQ